ncbi:MAG: CgeB family protein [Deltaproteobacteria bacterium]
MNAPPSPKVLLVGDFGPGQLARSYERGFQQSGAEVVRFPLGGKERLFGLPLNRLTRPLLQREIQQRRAEALIATATQAKPDLIFILKGEWLTSDALRELRSRTSAALANFYPDDPFSAPDVGPTLWEAFTCYDRVYVFSHSWIPRLLALGAKPAYLPFAWDPEMHPATPPQSPTCQLSFVGNWWPDREAWLEKLADFDLGLWGHWERLPRGSPLRSRVRGPAAYEAAMAELFSRSAITLNFIRIVANGHNMRSFEAPGAGAFLLSSRTPELAELFDDDLEIACFDTPAELLEKADFYLANPGARARVAEAGHRRCGGHAYAHRARTVVRDLHA